MLLTSRKDGGKIWKDGFSLGYSIYGGNERFNNTKQPIVICPNMNDLFTVNNTNGNSALTYPIGLITIDELMLSGVASMNGVTLLNPLTYTYSAANYYVMSPWYFDTTKGVGIHSVGDGNLGSIVINERSGIRPVINLSSNTEISGGIGTSNEPFVVK